MKDRCEEVKDGGKYQGDWHIRYIAEGPLGRRCHRPRWGALAGLAMNVIDEFEEAQVDVGAVKGRHFYKGDFKSIGRRLSVFRAYFPLRFEVGFIA